MAPPTRVNPKPTRRDEPIATRYPVAKRKLLEAIQERRGDRHLSNTISHALDQLIEKHFPGALEVEES